MLHAEQELLIIPNHLSLLHFLNFIWVLSLSIRITVLCLYYVFLKTGFSFMPLQRELVLTHKFEYIFGVFRLSLTIIYLHTFKLGISQWYWNSWLKVTDLYVFNNENTIWINKVHPTQTNPWIINSWKQ